MESQWVEKNWMFYGSDEGGRTAAVLTSLIATCKGLRIDPFTFLRDIFARISSHPQSRLGELLPYQWKAEGDPQRLLRKQSSPTPIST